MKFQGNNFDGSLPTELGLLVDLGKSNKLCPVAAKRLCLLSHNPSTGEINVGNNRLSGPLPSELGNLVHLSMSRTMYWPTNPPFSNMLHTDTIDVTANSLTGTLPLEVFQASNLRKSNKAYAIGVNETLTGNRWMTGKLRVDRNKFFGAIPFAVSQLQNLGQFQSRLHAMAPGGSLL